MKGTLTILTGAFLHLAAIGDPETSVTLYQIGSKGKYCLSLTKEDSGCISGMDQAGQAINLVDVTKGKKVQFENLSDAPHDMRITGANAENMPAQEVGAGAVYKKMDVEDRSKQSITCSFHGNQLGVGYRVLDDVAGGKPQANSEHRDRSKDGQLGDGGEASGEVEGPRAIVRTGLADVGKEIMGKGKPEDVAKLVAQRPELLDDLKKLRPILAGEVAEKLGMEGKEKLAGVKEGDVGEGADSDEYADEFGQGEGALSVVRLAALVQEQGIRAEETNGSPSRRGGATATASVNGTTMDELAAKAQSVAQAGVAGSDGRTIGAKLTANVPRRQLASASAPAMAPLPTDLGGQSSPTLRAFLAEPGKLGRLLLLVGLVALGFWGLYFALFARRNRKNGRVS